MKTLGRLNARSLIVGDLVRLNGHATKIIAVEIVGMSVKIETEMFHPVQLCSLEKVTVLSQCN